MLSGSLSKRRPVTNLTKIKRPTYFSIYQACHQNDQLPEHQTRKTCSLVMPELQKLQHSRRWLVKFLIHLGVHSLHSTLILIICVISIGICYIMSERLNWSGTWAKALFKRNPSLIRIFSQLRKFWALNK